MHIISFHFISYYKKLKMFSINTHLEFGQDAALGGPVVNFKLFTGMVDTECFAVLTFRRTAHYI